MNLSTELADSLTEKNAVCQLFNNKVDFESNDSVDP